MDDELTISFLAIIAPTTSALKVDGSGGGAKLTLAVGDQQLPEVLKSVLLREKLLKITIEAVE